MGGILQLEFVQSRLAGCGKVVCCAVHLLYLVRYFGMLAGFASSFP